MGKRTDKTKRDAKFTFRRQRSETIAGIRAEREKAFAEMFADIIEQTPVENIEALANGLEVSVGDQKIDLKPVKS
jgi:hypothetical protein